MNLLRAYRSRYVTGQPLVSRKEKNLDQQHSSSFAGRESLSFSKEIIS